MKKRTLIHKLTLALVLLSVFALGLTACNPQTPTPDAGKLATMVAQTVAVEIAKTEQARPTATNTPMPTPTNTPPPPPTTAPTATAQATSATPVYTGGQDAGVWTRSDPADGTVITAGKEFTVNVSLMNTGSTTWTTDYSLTFIDGVRFGADSPIKLPYQVPPSMTVTLSVKMTAPTSAGTARGNWVITNAAGVGFANFYFEYTIQ